MDTCGVGNLVGEVKRVDTTCIHVGEGVDTKSGVECILCLTMLVGIGFQNIYCREKFAVKRTGLVLVRPSGTQSIGTFAAKDTAVQLSGDRGKVLLLIVTGRLVIQRIFRLTTLAVAVEGVVSATNIDCGIRAADGAHRRRGLVGAIGVRVAETDIENVILVDVPVQAGQHFIVGSAQRVSLIWTRVIVVLVFQESGNLVQTGLSGTVVCGAFTPLIGLTGAGTTSRTGNIIHRVLGIDEEEQFVLDNGTTQRHANDIVEVLAGRQGVLTHQSSLKDIAVVIVIYRSMPLVATMLGDHIDGTALETAMTDIKGCEVDGNLVDSIQRKRAATCGQVGADTEGIVERSTVNSDRGATVVATTGCKTATHYRSLGSQFHDVVHAAAGRRNILNGLIVDESTGA